MRSPPRGRAALAAGAAGCGGTEHPGPIAARELAEAQTFPYYRVYWVGPRFEGHHLTAADGLHGYLERIGDSVYYGDCVKSKGIFGGGSCVLPLQVTTVIYRLHSNAALGPQRNTSSAACPRRSTTKGARSRSTRAASRSTSSPTRSPTRSPPRSGCCPINAPGTATGRPARRRSTARASPGPIPRPVATVMASLPRRICQRDAAQEAFAAGLRT